MTLLLSDRATTTMADPRCSAYRPRYFMADKTCSIVLVACTFFAGVGLPVTVHSQVPVAPSMVSVASVDLSRYAGKWFEIGSFPMFFQRNCKADTTAEYALAPDGVVQVTNRCRTDNGFDQATGQATAVEGFNNSRLKVSFFWPFKSDYWVIGLDADYRWAVVGNPNRKYLWVLSRTPQLSQPLLAAALASASAQGFDLSQLRYTTHAAVATPQ